MRYALTIAWGPGKANHFHWGLEEWLGDRDSNPDSMVQSHVSYRWTISQRRTSILAKGFPDFNDL